MCSVAFPHYTCSGVDDHQRHTEKIGTLVLSYAHMVMTYDEDYLASGLPKMNLIDDIATEAAPFFEYSVTQGYPCRHGYSPWPWGDCQEPKKEPLEPD